MEFIRTGLSLVAVIAIGSLAVGCGSSSSTTGSSSSSIPSLSLWHDSNFRADTIKNVIQSVDQTKATVTSKQLGNEVFENKTIDAIAADQAPDVWLLPNDWLPDNLNKLVTIPDNFWTDSSSTRPQTTTEHLKKLYAPFVATDLIGADNRSAGFPGPAETLILYINNKLFSKANDEWKTANPNASNDQRYQVQRILTQDLTTWDDFVSAVRMVTKKNGNDITQAGIAMGTATNVHNADDILQLLIFQQGGAITDSVKKVALFNNFEKKADGSVYFPGKDAFTFFYSFAKPGDPNYSWSTAFGDSRQAFMAGKVAMVIDYPDFDDQILQKKTDLSYRRVALPQMDKNKPVNFAQYYIAAVTKAAKNQKLAASLAKKVSVDSTSITSAWPGSAPALISSSDTPNTKQLQTAKTVYKLHHNDFDSAFLTMIDDVALRGQSIENALHRTADQITNILQSE